jgi:hypothetical protein
MAGSNGYNGYNTCVIYNAASCVLGVGAVNVDKVDSCTTVEGDVIGVVVDLIVDEIRFYKNAKLVARGKEKPSKMQPIYAAIFPFYQDMRVSMCEKYSYQELRDK